MAGITALFSPSKKDTSLRKLLEQTLRFSFPLPDAQTVLAETYSEHIAFGGVFPKHFQRKESFVCHGNYTLLFYGELYNELDSLTEAEYTLPMFEKYGVQYLPKLNGPFAFFCWNEQEQTLLAATDRLGRFPLFYCLMDETICITTDLHPLFASGLMNPSLAQESVIDFLTIGFPLGEKTMFDGIKRATAGEYLICSPNEIEKKRYWKPEYSNSLSDTQPMVEVFRQCNERAMAKRPGSVVALSGGWDSRATIATLSANKDYSLMTFGEKNSTDVSLASEIATQLQLQHEIISADNNFFNSFQQLANEVIALGNGHVTIDLAFQLFAFKQLSPHYPMLLDSAGCEFRRGIKAKLAAQQAKASADISDFLLSMYSTGIWNDEIIDKEMFMVHNHSTLSHLTQWLGETKSPTFEDEIDAFSWYELWSHHYAHGTPLQTSIIACHMPYSDNEFYDLFLQADRSIRWSHKFHQSVIKSLQPSLERFPISYGHVRVPYGEHPFRYTPMAYHRIINKASSVSGLHWLNRFDNSKPFRPYHKWYAHELEQYTHDMLNNQSFLSSGYINKDGVSALLQKQKSSPLDFSHGISMVLTLAHLLKYIHECKTNPPPHSPSLFSREGDGGLVRTPNYH